MVVEGGGVGWGECVSVCDGDWGGVVCGDWGEVVWCVDWGEVVWCVWCGVGVVECECVCVST